jgi:hypothetical protein
MPSDTLTAAAAPQEAAPLTPDIPGGWRNAWRRGLMTWLTAVAGYTVLTFFAAMNTPGSGFLSRWQNWGNWDYSWYEMIAESGYDGIPAFLAAKAPAFYPLYPTLIHVTGWVLPGPTLLTAQLLSATFFAGFLVVFYRLVEQEFGAGTASRSLWLVIAFPAAFFLFAPYNMSLLLLLMVSAFYAIRRQNWWLAGVLGGLTVLTRPSGLILVLPFAYEYLRRRNFQLKRIRLDVLWIGAIPAGLASYMAYCWVVLGDAFAPSHAQALWTRGFDLPFMPVVWTVGKIWQDFSSGTADIKTYTSVYDIVAVLFAGTLVVLGFVGPWKFRKDQLALPLTALGIFLFSLSFPLHLVVPELPQFEVTKLESMIRYVLELFPAFIVLARITRIERAYVFISLTLQGFLILQFLSGNWVA